MKKIKEYVMRFIQGFCMALADSVPGVSGGTVAFVLDFYDEFITSLDNLFRGKKQERIKAIQFLVKIAIGWAIGFLLAATILSGLFNTKIYLMSSLFIGFIIFAIPLVIKEEKKEFKGKYKNIIFMLLGMALVILISSLNGKSGFVEIKGLNHINIGLLLYVFFTGMIAISAMILPGISGSTLLLIFGLYIPIMNAIKETLKFNFAYIPVLICFGLGICFGIVFFVKLIRKCLEKYRSQTMYAILGLMLGSLYAIVLGPTTLENPLPMLSMKTFDILFFIIGGIIIIGLDKLKDVLNKK